MRHEFWFDRPVDASAVARALREIFSLPDDEAVFVGPLEETPTHRRPPRVRAFTATGRGEFPWKIEVIVDTTLDAQTGELEPFVVGGILAESVGVRALFPDGSHDPVAWVLADPVRPLLQVRVDHEALRGGQLRVVEELPPSGVPVVAGEPVEPPDRAVPLATLLAAREYLRDQMIAAARRAYPGVEPFVDREDMPAVVQHHASGLDRYNCSVSVTTAEGRPDRSAERAVRNLSCAFGELGWQVREPAEERSGDGTRWSGDATRGGYGVMIVTHQREGLIHLGGYTPNFFLRQWDVPGA